LASAKPWVTFPVSLYFTPLLILLLPERKFLNIIPAVAGIAARCSLARVEVLYIAVETRATTTGFGASRALREECGILKSAEAKGVHCEREGYSEMV
jgi:hypothetical protein